MMLTIWRVCMKQWEVSAKFFEGVFFEGVIINHISRHHRKGMKKWRGDVLEEYENVSSLFMRREDVVEVDEFGVEKGYISLIFVYTQNLWACCWKRRWLLEELYESNGPL